MSGRNTDISNKNNFSLDNSPSEINRTEQFLRQQILTEGEPALICSEKDSPLTLGSNYRCFMRNLNNARGQNNTHLISNYTYIGYHLANDSDREYLKNYYLAESLQHNPLPDVGNQSKYSKYEEVDVYEQKISGLPKNSRLAKLDGHLTSFSMKERTFKHTGNSANNAYRYLEEFNGIMGELPYENASASYEHIIKYDTNTYLATRRITEKLTAFTDAVSETFLSESEIIHLIAVIREYLGDDIGNRILTDPAGQRTHVSQQNTSKIQKHEQMNFFSSESVRNPVHLGNYRGTHHPPWGQPYSPEPLLQQPLVTNNIRNINSTRVEDSVNFLNSANSSVNTRGPFKYKNGTVVFYGGVPDFGIRTALQKLHDLLMKKLQKFKDPFPVHTSYSASIYSSASTSPIVKTEKPEVKIVSFNQGVPVFSSESGKITSALISLLKEAADAIANKAETSTSKKSPSIEINYENLGNSHLEEYNHDDLLSTGPDSVVPSNKVAETFKPTLTDENEDHLKVGPSPESQYESHTDAFFKNENPHEVSRPDNAESTDSVLVASDTKNKSDESATIRESLDSSVSITITQTQDQSQNQGHIFLDAVRPFSGLFQGKPGFLAIPCNTSQYFLRHMLRPQLPGRTSLFSTYLDSVIKNFRPPSSGLYNFQSMIKASPDSIMKLGVPLPPNSQSRLSYPVWSSNIKNSNYNPWNQSADKKQPIMLVTKTTNGLVPLHLSKLPSELSFKKPYPFLVIPGRRSGSMIQSDGVAHIQPPLLFFANKQNGYWNRTHYAFSTKPPSFSVLEKPNEPRYALRTRNGQQAHNHEIPGRELSYEGSYESDLSKLPLYIIPCQSVNYSDNVSSFTDTSSAQPLETGPVSSPFIVVPSKPNLGLGFNNNSLMNIIHSKPAHPESGNEPSPYFLRPSQPVNKTTNLSPILVYQSKTNDTEKKRPTHIFIPNRHYKPAKNGTVEGTLIAIPPPKLTVTQFTTASTATDLPTTTITSSDMPGTTIASTFAEVPATKEAIASTFMPSVFDIPLTELSTPPITEASTSTVAETSSTVEIPATVMTSTLNDVLIATEFVTTTELPAKMGSSTTTEALTTFTEQTATDTPTDVPMTTETLTATESLSTRATPETLTATESLSTCATPETLTATESLSTRATSEATILYEISTDTESSPMTETSTFTQSLISPEVSRSTEIPSTTEYPAITEISNTTEFLTYTGKLTTDVLYTIENHTISFEFSTTTEATTNTEFQSTTETSTLVESPTGTETTTAEVMITSEVISVPDIVTISMTATTTETPTTFEDSNTTKLQTTTSFPTTTEAITTIENAAITSTATTTIQTTLRTTETTTKPKRTTIIPKPLRASGNSSLLSSTDNEKYSMIYLDSNKFNLNTGSSSNLSEGTLSHRRHNDRFSVWERFLGKSPPSQKVKRQSLSGLAPISWSIRWHLIGGHSSYDKYFLGQSVHGEMRTIPTTSPPATNVMMLASLPTPTPGLQFPATEEETPSPVTEIEPPGPPLIQVSPLVSDLVASRARALSVVRRSCRTLSNVAGEPGEPIDDAEQTQTPSPVEMNRASTGESSRHVGGYFVVCL
ncbi:hypothetical protein SK128_003527 [Halocaridina rubra]|uniref:Uncharacterized protein n=1 Tax=Halocaridina rubra TaxID=373956 RepID=A0AAN8XAZ8_HALRR